MDNELGLLQQWCKNLVEQHMFNLILTSLVLLLPFLYIVNKIIGRSKKLNLPPSPPKLPIIGNLHQLGKSPHQAFRTLSEKYGPLMLLHFGKSPVLIVQSAELAKEIMRSNNDFEFAGRPSIRAANDLFFGCTDIAFCPYNEYWRQTKKFCVLELLSKRRVQEFQMIREEEIAKIVETIRALCSNGKAEEPINFTEMSSKITNDVISRCSLGRIYENDDVSFGQLSRNAVNLLGAVCFEDLFPFMRWVDVLTGFSSNLKRTCKALHDFLDRVIEEHRASMRDNYESDRRDFVDILLRHQKDEAFGVNFTQDNLKAVLMDMFVAGTDTTATVLEWTMAEIMKNPRVMKKAQEEVRRIVGKKSKIDEADIDKMEYLKYVIQESLRLHAPAVITRATSADAKLGGFDIPQKTTILINAWAIQRDPNLWDNPEEFIPERFAESLVDFRGQHSQLIPFGAGRRICPGISFAAAEIECVLANLLYWFDWELPAGASVENLDMNEVYDVFIRKKVPLHLIPILHSP